jgi:DNA-binding PucR family transcriptional regulator
VAGLRASAAEAGAAIAAAKTAGRRDTALSFDAVGLRRMLVEWYASDTARRAVDSILAPLDSLGPKRSETAIKTLQAYLDNQGSFSKTAKALHLHRNAVAYRLKRILEVLDVDLENPDERLILQLACRTRALV